MPISHSKLGEIFGVEQSSPFAWQVDPGGEEGGVALATSHGQGEPAFVKQGSERI